MKPMYKHIVLAVSAAALLGATAATPALADSRRNYHHRHGGNTGAYIGLGFGALALGALAYAASQPTYYAYAPPAYYYPPPAPPPYPYYYGPPPGYVYDPYTNTYVPGVPSSYYDRHAN